MKAQCSIAGCDRTSYCRGWCHLHYKRWSHTGDPLATLIAPRGARLQTLIELMQVDHDDCIVWPFTPSSNGYGAVSIDNRTVAAHVYVCRQAHGPKPSANHEVAHSCGNRLCVNRRHVRWATHAENIADQALHGRGKWMPSERPGWVKRRGRWELARTVDVS